ncbi:MAG: YifB family Mg chelatase-like AAA ATPase [Bacteroidales bacterium]|nr:YifB family Mg chelatase-like AAA ATPase [Bacteroidales bacterium]
MDIVRAYCATSIGLEVVPVTVEASTSRGIGIHIVGLPDSSVKESLLRVISAMECYGFHFPGWKLVINMAPADIRKEGSGFDAAIAIATLLATKELPPLSAENFLIVGELALDGGMRPVSGILPIAVQARKLGFKACIFPKDNALEACEIQGVDIFGVESLLEITQILKDPSSAVPVSKLPRLPAPASEKKEQYDFADVKGQSYAKRGLEIACSGGHNVLLCGSPGSGKSFMAKCMAGILPPMSHEESMSTSMIYSVAGKMIGRRGLIKERPFRSPHHTASMVSIVGGGANASPGEISLANAGILYLDEMLEYPSSVLEVLRQPLEDREIMISRARYKVCFPCSFMLVGSMNPCPCGYAGDPTHHCSCSPGAIDRYRSKLSGPLMDRMDLNITVFPVKADELVSEGRAESSAEIARRVLRVRALQIERFRPENADGQGKFFCNAQMSAQMISRYCPLGKEEKDYVTKIMERYGLTGRGYSRMLKVARTIADMDGSEDIHIPHLAEAVQFRMMV